MGREMRKISPFHRASPTTSPRGTIIGRGFMKQEASTSRKHLTIWRLHRDQLNHCRSDKGAYPAVPSICAGRSCGHIHGRDDVVFSHHDRISRYGNRTGMIGTFTSANGPDDFRDARLKFGQGPVPNPVPKIPRPPAGINAQNEIV